MMPKTGTWLRVRREYRESIAAADAHSELVFNVARGVPRQGALRAELEAKRAARLARDVPRAKHGVTQ